MPIYLDWHFSLIIQSFKPFKLSFSEIIDNIRKAIITYFTIKKLNKLLKIE